MLSDAAFIFGTHEAAKRADPNKTHFYFFKYLTHNTMDPMLGKYHEKDKNGEGKKELNGHFLIKRSV